MQEKKITMDDALKVWWFMAWRTTLLTIASFVLLTLILSFIKDREVVRPLVSSLSFIISITISVYFTKKAINRSYKDFRLSATLLNN